MLPKTKALLDILSKDELFKKEDIMFVGGTALSLRIKHRLSEDIDFGMKVFNSEVILETMEKYGAIRTEQSLEIKDAAINDGFYESDGYLSFLLNDVKVDFFEVPFKHNKQADDIWNNDKFTYYDDTNLRVMSLQGIIYLKGMAFWSRKKYRDLFDIYFVVNNQHISIEEYMQMSIRHNEYSYDDLLLKIKDKKAFSRKLKDEGLNTLVDNPMPYEWYRNYIEEEINRVIKKKMYEEYK